MTAKPGTASDEPAPAAIALDLEIAAGSGSVTSIRSVPQVDQRSLDDSAPAAGRILSRCREEATSRGRISAAAQRRSLFASMSNHIANSVICRPAMRSTATRTIVAGRDLVPGDAEDDLDQPEQEARRRHQHAEDVEEDERVEVADHVLLPHPPPEALEQEPRDPRDDRAQLDPRLLADVVDRPRGNVPHARVLHVQVDEHVVREAVARVEPVEVEPPQRVAARSPCTRPASRRRASSPEAIFVSSESTAFPR